MELAQAFRADTPLDISTALSKSTTFHNGVDITCGPPEQTWGLELVWSFPWPGIVYDAMVDAPLGAMLHAHSQIDTVDPTTQIQYSVIYLHVSYVTHPKMPQDAALITYNQGEVIGRIGNNGFVNPAPTPARPLDGSHLHLGLGVKKPGDLNFLMVDPLMYFDLANPYISPSTSYKFMVNLVFGQRGVDIENLQKVLQREGCYPATQSITGYYGPITAKAVLSFRVKYWISSASDPLGHSVGPLTRAQLNKL